MAKRRKADCTELQQVISDIALAIGMQPDMNIDKITAEMKKELPWIDRDMVTESIVAANRTVQEEMEEDARRMAAIKHEARVSEKTKKAIDDYQAAVKGGSLMPGRTKKPATSTVELQRAARDALVEEYRRALPSKTKRMVRSQEKLLETIKDMENGVHITPQRLTELEKYPELKTLFDQNEALRQAIRGMPQELKRKARRQLELIERDLKAIEDGTYKPRKPAERKVSDDPELEAIYREIDDKKDRKNELIRDENTKARLRARADELRKHLKEGTLPKKKDRVPAPEEIEALREINRQLNKQIYESSPAKAIRLKESADKAIARAEAVKDGTYVAPVRVSEIEQYPEHFKLILARDRAQKDAEARIRAMKPRTVGDWIAEPFNFSKAIMASIDDSAVGRQGGIALGMQPKMVGKRIPASLKAIKFWGNKDNTKFFGEKGDRWHDVGEEFVAEVMTDIDNRYWRPMYHAGKLALTEPDNAKGIGKREEEFVSYLMDYLKYGKNKAISAAQKPIDASQRSYVAYLNLVRSDFFDMFADAVAPDGDLSIEQAKIIAGFVNDITGRSSFGSGVLQSSTAGLNALFWAPRLIYSRLRFLTFAPVFRARKDPKLRKMILKQYGNYGKSLLAFYGIAAVAGTILAKIIAPDDEDWFKIEYDPRGDFGKVKIGNLRFDLMSGLAQIIRTGTRVAAGEKVSQDGTVIPLREGRGSEKSMWTLDSIPTFTELVTGEDLKQQKYKPQTMGGELLKFLRTKLNPGFGEVINHLSGAKDVVGNDVTMWTSIRNLSIPLTPREFAEAMIEEGVPAGLANGFANFFGVGAQVYSEREDSGSSLPPGVKPLKRVQ